MKPQNTLTLVETILLLFQQHNLTCYLFGGRAEEVLCMRQPGPHNDIDLIYFDRDFDSLDGFLSRLPHGIEELGSKHFPHKRAFLIEDVVCELLLVSRVAANLETNFWGKYRYVWPNNILDADPMSIGTNQFSIVAPEALIQYRSDYELINSLRSQYMTYKPSFTHRHNITDHVDLG